MNRAIILTFGLTTLAWGWSIGTTEAAPAPMTNTPIAVQVETSQGNFTLELYPERAPRTVENFLVYVDEGFYRKMIFHRVIPNFMIQGGGYEAGTGNEKQAREAIKNESNNGLPNKRGTIAVARTQDPHSGTCQFFINLKDNVMLDAANARDKMGYCVFGKVIEGIEVIDQIAGVKTTTKGNLSDFPVEEVVIFSMRRIKR